MILNIVDPSVVQLINNVGFPIVAFLLMYRLATNTIKENTEALKNLKLQMERSNTGDNNT